ncbi:glycogen synthase [Engelhardtia mirabilis]|uniref:Glycogen synthase n=1 Tax=Engelhardtia mirabilis TaxID=2528011 RepID=A0A518BQQ0_9BACT|nr:Glycogen synthase [Planctomycetes bacterium Pla133]QDV03612.1 Glycogen synthase [Planctomycetes bacterium Pla86]
MKVAFVTPELHSLVRRTNLASVAQDLARALRSANADCRVFMPNTKDVEQDKLTDLERIATVPVDSPQGRVVFDVLRGHLDGLPVFLFDQAQLFGGRHPYGDENGPHEDNWKRYALFSRAVLASFPSLDFPADVIHGLDWTFGTLPLFHQLHYLGRDTGLAAERAGTFFSIHNLAMQGSFEREILPRMGVPHEYFRLVDGVELAGKVNFLKTGAEFATVIGTHSPTHALKIQEQDRGYGLEDTFQRRKKELIGIHNGVDYASWNPSTDRLLAAPFSAKAGAAGKAKCKADLQKSLLLDGSDKTLLACHIGRWDADSGFDLLAEVLALVLEHDVELVAMGAGGEDITRRLRTIEGTFVGRVRIIEGYDAAAAHRLLAGSDVLLMPSHYQPANPLFAIALRYGVLPIVYTESGLEDTMPDAETAKDGLSFHFDPYTGDGLLATVLRAAQLHKDGPAWDKLVARALSQDYSWERTAADYLKAYRRVTRRIRGR